MDIKTLLEKMSFSEKTQNKTILLWILLLVISIIILIVWILYLKINLSWDNLVYLVSWLFISGLALILFPLYFQNNIDKITIQEKVNEINKNKKEFLENLKEITDKKLKKHDWYVPFSTTRFSWKFKEIFRWDDFNLRVWLEDDDFGRFYIVPKNNWTFKEYNNFIKSKEDWEENIYTYKDSFSWTYNDLEKQVDDIIKKLNIK